MKAPYAASIWFLVFGFFHLLWVSGFYIGLDSEMAVEAFRRPWFYKYNVVVTILCIAGTLLSLSLRKVPKQRWARAVNCYGGWIAAILLSLRSVGSLVQVVGGITAGTFAFTLMQLWEIWFYLGTVLFNIAFVNYLRATKAYRLRNDYSLR